MSGIAAIVEKLLLAAVVTEKAWMPRRSKADWALAAFSVLLAGGGVSYLVLALDRYLGGVYPPYVAAVSRAACLFAAALTVAFILAVRRHRHPVRTALVGDTRGALATNVHAMIESACGGLESPVKEHPKMAVLLATLAGVFLAERHLKP